jgi:conjugative relaxase-like TrwC/TraI family protein
VLSIGKLSAGQASYYLDSVEARVDAVTSIGGGLEDYYVGSGEARGVWVGSGAAALGLGGEVDGDALRRVLAGCDPSRGEPLRSSSSPVRVAGFDLTFSAPKSVSVVFGITDERVRAQVRLAHDRAVGEALAYLERSAAAVRRGHGGVRLEQADGLVAAAFRHRTSRAGDPQLHTHVVVANIGRGPDGRWSALDGRQLYAHARAASFLYQAVLRSELTRELGLEWRSTQRGIAELAGVPKRVREAFSRRRVEIDAALEMHGTSGARAAEAAALATRRAKRHDINPTMLVGGWRSRAAEVGFAREDLERLLGRARVRSARPDWHAILDELAGPMGLTRRSSTFTHRDVVQALCEAVRPDVAIDAESIAAAADAFLASSRVVPLIPSAPDASEAFRRRDGRLMPVQREQIAYSTHELLQREQELIARVRGSQGARRGMAPTSEVKNAIRRHPTLSGEQQRMVERLCLEGDGVSVVVGKAGTGKTFALVAAREAWQAAGHPVLAWRSLGVPLGSSSTTRASRRPASPLCWASSASTARERCRPTASSSSMRPAWSPPASSHDSSRRPTRSRASSCSSATTANCPSSRPAARSVVWSTADWRSNSQRTTGKSTPGSAPPSSTCARVDRNAPCPPTRLTGGF